MRSARRYVLGGFIAVATAAVGISVASPAQADCQDSGGVTVCAQGSVTGGGQSADSSGPYMPYDCQDDWLCSNGPDSLVYGGNGGCTTPYGTYQNCAVQGRSPR
jgi:hypothetical protein